MGSNTAEIDLTGFDKMIAQTQKLIDGLNKELKNTETRVKSLGDAAAQSNLNSLNSSLQAMGKILFDIKTKASDGKTGVTDFASAFSSLNKEIKNFAGSNLPITGLFETVRKLREASLSLSGALAIQPYKEKLTNSVMLLDQLFQKIKNIVAPIRQISQATQQTAQAQQNVTNATQQATQAQQQATRATTQQAQTQQRALNAQKLHLNSITAAIQRSHQLISQGNTSMISSYLRQGMTISRLQNALNGLKAAQENVNLSTEQGRKKYQQIDAEIKKIEVALSSVNGVQSSLSGIMSKMKSGFGQIATSFGLMTGVFGATNFFRSLYRITAEFQLQQKALGAIVQNAYEANILFKRMQSLAVESPMKLLDLNKYAKQLSAFRIETQGLYDTLKMLGDISVGVGVDMDRLILAYGQVKAANYLRGQELRQFSEAGVNILGGLRDYYQETKNINMSINEIFDSVSKRKVLFEDVDAVLRRMTESGGTFYNMQLIQSQTLYGQLQKLGDIFQIQMNEIGTSTSGILLFFVKLVQTLTSNLKLVLAVVGAFATYTGVRKLVVDLQKGTLVSKEFKMMLEACRVQASLLTKAGWKELIANIRGATAASAGLKANLVGLGASLALLAGSFVYSAIQKHNQRLDETADRLTEIRKRAYEVQNIEKQFKSKTSYKERLALLQQLNEKAEEFGYHLRIAENVTPQNISKVWQEALKNFNDYNDRVAKYESAAANRPGIERNTKDLARLAGTQALAYEEARRDYEFFTMNADRLNAEARKELETITKIKEDFIKNEREATLEYGYTSKQFETVFAESMLRIRQIVHGVGGGLAIEFEKERGAFNTYLKKFFKGGFFGQNDYESELNDVKRKLAKAAKDVGLVGAFVGTEDDIRKKIEETYPAWKSSLKGIPDIIKPELPNIFAEITGAIPKLVLDVDWRIDHNESDLNDKQWVEDYRNYMQESGFEYDESQNAYVVDAKVDVVYGDYEDPLQIKDIEKDVTTVKRALTDLNVSGQEDMEEFKKRLEDRQEKLKEFIDKYTKQVALLKFINSEFGENIDFSSYETAIASLKSEAEIISKVLKDVFGGVSASGSGRSTDVTSRYRSMVDFIKKLNTEYEKLRKNFDRDESGGFMGAFDRIIESYKGEFGEMPKRFREAFGESIANIDFSTKEGSKKGEQIVKSIIEGAKDLTQKQKDELKRYVERAIGDITLDIDVKAKKESDERLNAQVQKMFDDYNLTVELKKLDINPDALGKMFNINTKDLATLQRQVESLAEQFTGEEQEKKYREYMRKIVEINDKANLEMAKNYSKYLREEFGERAKLELEYMRKRAEIYALPFDDEQQSRIIENLQKETQEKLDKLEWDEFRGSDYYVEMFEDLGRVSTQALQGMIDKLGEMRGKLSELSPTEYKTLVEQMQKITDELVRRNPFKALVTAIGEIKRVQGSDSEEGRLIRTWLGIKPDEKIRNFYKSFQQALNNIRLNLQQAESEGNLTEKLLGAARERDEAIKSLKSGGALADLSEIDFFNVEKLQEKEKDLKDEYDRLTEIINTGLGGIDPTKDMERRNAINSTLKILGTLISSLQTLGEKGKTSVSTSTLEQSLRVIKQKIAEYKEQADKLGDVDALIKDQQEAIKQLADAWQDAMGKVKTTFDTVFDNLDYLGGTTDGVTEAWKELGDTIFDTVIQSIGLIAQFSAAAVAGETAINAAAGWIGLIAEAVTLIVTGISQIFKIKDAKIAKEMETIQKNMDKLKKTAEDLKGVFNNLFNEEELRAYDAAIIRTKELYIEQLEAMIRSEESKKKSDQAAIDGWRDEIESTYNEIREQTEDFYNSVGGLGGQSEMKAQAEEWTNAWYEAFKETGDGLQGLEDSFDSFLDEIFKKQILNQLSSKYFKDLFEKLNTILGTGGGLQSNIDDFTEWVDDVHEQFGRFSEEAQQLAEIFYGAGGLGGGLEGLQASIQGMTEQTAELLAAYLNSIRFYVSDNSEQIAALTEALTVDNGTNPIIEQLKVIAQQTTSINLLLDSVVRPSGWTGTGSGAYIKVGFGQMPQ